MSFSPEQYSRFVSLVRNNAPCFPIDSETSFEHDRAAAGRALGALETLADELNVDIPGPVGAAVSAATANSAGYSANSMMGITATMSGQRLLGSAAGPFIDGLAVLARGTFQSLDRSDAMVRYLLGSGGYINTISRCCLSAINNRVAYTRFPEQAIPDFVLRTGEIYSDWRRQAYMAGYNAAVKVFREMDAIKPSNGDCYSKNCLTHIVVQANQTGEHAEGNWRLRRACEQIIVRDMLSLNLRQRTEQLRRWANSP